MYVCMLATYQLYTFKVKEEGIEMIYAIDVLTSSVL